MALPPGPVVVLTREPEDNLALAEALRARGVPVLEVPCLATRYLDGAGLPDEIDAVAFTSRRGVRGLLRRGVPRWRRAPGEPGPLIAAVGRATARALEEAGVRVDLVADPPSGEVLARDLRERLWPGARVAVVRGNLRAGGLDEALTAAGLDLEPVEVYENVECDVPAIEPFDVAGVLVASPSAGRRLLAANPWLKESVFLAVGATTMAALEALGVRSIRPVGTELEGWIDAAGDVHHRALERRHRERQEER